ncbi:hypothetical protein OG381_46330 [Streptomyces sp. NBC_00490]
MEVIPDEVKPDASAEEERVKLAGLDDEDHEREARIAGVVG